MATTEMLSVDNGFGLPLHPVLPRTQTGMLAYRRHADAPAGSEPVAFEIGFIRRREFST
jgi:hypothetical protein